MPICKIPLRNIFSVLSELYKWFTALYLAGAAVYAVKNRLCYTNVVLFGNVFFAVSLIFDRIYPIYEPIFGGWFPETGCIAAALAAGYEYWRKIAAAYRLGIAYGEERKRMEKQIRIQKENYAVLTEKLEETKRLRHDLRQHFRVISTMLQSREYDSLTEYINRYNESINEICPAVFCDNPALNAVLNYYFKMAGETDIEFDIVVSAKKDIPISDTDISILFGNLIENAIDACERQKDGGRRVKLSCSVDSSQIIFGLENTYSGRIRTMGGKLCSVRNNGFGIGLDSVRKVVDKYDGVLDISYTDTVFTVSFTMSFGIGRLDELYCRTYDFKKSKYRLDDKRSHRRGCSALYIRSCKL